MSLQQDTTPPPPSGIVQVHLLNGDEITLHGIDVHSDNVETIREKIRAAFSPSPSSSSAAAEQGGGVVTVLRLFLSQTHTELNDPRRTLASYVTSSSTIHLDLLVAIVSLESNILSPEASNQLIEWVQQVRGKEVVGSTLIMRASEVYVCAAPRSVICISPPPLFLSFSLSLPCRWTEDSIQKLSIRCVMDRGQRIL